MFGKKQIGDVVAISACSDSNIQKLLELSNSFSDSDKFILLLENKEKIPGRIIPGYINAKLRQYEKSMRSSSLQKEVLLFIAGTMNIKNAIEKVGAKSESDFIVFGNSEKLLLEFIKLGKLKKVKKIDLSLDFKTAYEVAYSGLE